MATEHRWSVTAWLDDESVSVYRGNSFFEMARAAWEAHRITDQVVAIYWEAV